MPRLSVFVAARVGGLAHRLACRCAWHHVHEHDAEATRMEALATQPRRESARATRDRLWPRAKVRGAGGKLGTQANGEARPFVTAPPRPPMPPPPPPPLPQWALPPLDSCPRLRRRLPNHPARSAAGDGGSSVCPLIVLGPRGRGAPPNRSAYPRWRPSSAACSWRPAARCPGWCWSAGRPQAGTPLGSQPRSS
eukprot:364708-Chlamydomonas_euryale.AAC.17